MSQEPKAEDYLFVCSIHDLGEGECASISRNGKSYFVVNKEGSCFGYLNACPHLGTHLEFQENKFLTLDKSLIQCAMHGALFEIQSGLCISGPCNGQSLEPVACEIQGEAVVLIA